MVKVCTPVSVNITPVSRKTLLCLHVALNYGNGKINTSQLKSLQSAFYPWFTVCIEARWLHGKFSAL